MTAPSDPTPEALATAKRQRRYKILVGTAAVGATGGLVWILTNGKVKVPLETMVKAATEQAQGAVSHAVEAGTNQRNSPAAHMVSGHMKKQVYGPGRTLVRDIFIDGYPRGGAAAA